MQNVSNEKDPLIQIDEETHFGVDECRFVSSMESKRKVGLKIGPSRGPEPGRTPRRNARKLKDLRCNCPSEALVLGDRPLST